ncbi:MAG: DUF262 domain-containing protein [Elusimicrobiaceae bacterium]|nr:DUF262 domain-containing protein [Elusimicrobiaceae bacterium]
MADWEKYKLEEVIEDIKEDKYVLPVIQRGFVWNEEKMELLFDSLLKGNSFGSIIVLEEEKDSKPLFEFRKFTKNGEEEISKPIDFLPHAHKFVIDGQQRLQSFYIGILGHLDNKTLYFDLLGDYKTNYDFRFSQDKNKLNTKKEDDHKTPCFWYPIPDLFKLMKEANEYDSVAEDLIEQYKEQYNFDENTKKTVKENLKAFYKNVFNQDVIGVAQVKFNKKQFSETERKEKVLELFKRLNDGGTQLSAIDLIASKLKSFNYKMEDFLRKLERDFKDINLTLENLIKLIFILQDNSVKQMSQIDESDTTFALNNETRIINTLLMVREFLKQADLYEYYENSTNRSFVPIFFIAYSIFHKDIKDADILHIWDKVETSSPDFNPMKKWIYYSLLNGVFRSKGAGWTPYTTGINCILNIMKNHQKEIFPCEELFDLYRDYPLKNFTLQNTISNLDKFDDVFLYYLIYGKEFRFRKNDIDHIMPKKILNNYHYDDTMINSIKNFQLLDYGTNRGVKKDKPFKEWINNAEYVKNKRKYISIHLIPENESLWTEDKFPEFTKSRGEMLVNLINKKIG